MLDTPRTRYEPFRSDPKAPEPHAARFYRTSAYQGTVWFDCYDDQWGQFSLELRETADPYDPTKHGNYPPGEYQRDVIASLGILHARRPDRACVIRPETVAAFNAWRLREHQRVVAHMDANPDRYLFPPDDPMRKPPMTARGGFWRDGWQTIAD